MLSKEACVVERPFFWFYPVSLAVLFCLLAGLTFYKNYPSPGDSVGATLYEAVVPLMERRLSVHYDDFWRAYIWRDRSLPSFWKALRESKILILDGEIAGHYLTPALTAHLRKYFKLDRAVRIGYYTFYAYQRRIQTP